MAVTLVMFDIDGTLTESSDLDSATFIDALREVFGFRDVSDDWGSYPHATDAGILAELCRVRESRPPTESEARRMQDRYVELLAERIAAAGGLRRIPGTAEILARLDASPDHAVALASGAWRASARLKLHAAALPTDDFPAAFSDDDSTREGICRISRQRAEARCGRRFERVVYVGDGVWDVRTSRHLGFGFIGIGRDAGADKLRAEGASRVVPDFRDAQAFLGFLASDEATTAANDRTAQRQPAQ